MKTVKSIHTKRYSVELVKVNELYYIRYEKSVIHGEKLSEAIKDYSLASYLFDLKLNEFEGH